MALYEYNVGDNEADAWYNCYNSGWLAQTFTPVIAHSVRKVSLFLYKVGSPSAITVSIRDTTGGDPSGTDKAVGTIAAASIGTATSGSWVDCIFSSAYALDASSLYAIVIRCTGSFGNMVAMGQYRGPSPYDPYANGTSENSVNSGTSWTTIPLGDFMFKEYSLAAFPTDAVARATSIRHIWQPSLFRMQVGVGDIGFDIDVAESAVRKVLDTAKEIEEAPPEPIVPVTKPSPRPPPSAEVPTPEPGELTEYAKDILRKPAAKALQARITGIREGVGAVVTPYAIDVLMQKEQEARLLMELQRFQKLAATPGITGYTRQVLIKKSIELKQSLEALYKRRRTGEEFTRGYT